MTHTQLPFPAGTHLAWAGSQPAPGACHQGDRSEAHTRTLPATEGPWGIRPAPLAREATHFHIEDVAVSSGLQPTQAPPALPASFSWSLQGLRGKDVP